MKPCLFPLSTWWITIFNVLKSGYCRFWWWYLEVCRNLTSDNSLYKFALAQNNVVLCFLSLIAINHKIDWSVSLKFFCFLTKIYCIPVYPHACFACQSSNFGELSFRGVAFNMLSLLVVVIDANREDSVIECKYDYELLYTFIVYAPNLHTFVREGFLWLLIQFLCLVFQKSHLRNLQHELSLLYLKRVSKRK